MSYQRKREDKRRLEKLSKENGFAYFNENKNRYVQYFVSSKSKYTKFLKRLSNKKIRKVTDIPRKGNYRKHFEYWWTLF